jgi:nitroreductase
MKAIMNRRSIRKYTSQDVSDEQVKVLLKAAMCAPSAGNEQPWQFVVIRDRQLLDQAAIPSIFRHDQTGAVGNPDMRGYEAEKI